MLDKILQFIGKKLKHSGKIPIQFINGYASIGSSSQYQKIGNIVQVSAYFNKNTTIPTSWEAICQLPEGYRANMSFYFSGIHNSSGKINVHIGEDGIIEISAVGGTPIPKGVGVGFHVMYLTK